MKKNILKDIEKIKEERNISKKVEKEIFEKAIANWAIGISSIILIIAFMVAATFLPKTGATMVYNISAIVFLIFSIVIIEIAYKKDSGELALTSVELLVISLFTLFSPYIFIRINYGLIYSFIGLVSVYYIFKIIRIYFSEKEKYLNEISDITDIVKKESKDELAKQEIEKRKIEQQKNKQTAKKTRTKKITTTPKKKTTTKKNSTTSKSNKKTKKSSTTTKKTVNKGE